MPILEHPRARVPLVTLQSLDVLYPALLLYLQFTHSHTISSYIYSLFSSKAIENTHSEYKSTLCIENTNTIFFA